MKSVCGHFLACCLVLGCASAFGQAPDLSNTDLVLQSVPDGPIAKVNGVNIKKEEFVSLYQNELLGAMARLQTSKISDRIRLDVAIHSMRSLVQHEILYQEAMRRKLSVSDEDMKKQWAATLEQLKKALPHAAGKPLSEEEVFQQAGVSREDAMAGLKKALLMKAMREGLAKEKKLQVTDAEVAEFFEKRKDSFQQPAQLHLQQVFVSTRANKVPFDEKKKAEARAKIDNVVKRIHAGESFEAVAKALSEAPDRDKGGDMGMLPAPALPPFFTEPAAKMKLGEISDVIESELGFHLFKVIESVPGAPPSLEKAAPIIHEVLLAAKTDEAADEFCKPLLDKSGYVEVHLQLDKTLASYPGGEELLKDMRTAGKEEAPKEAKPKESKLKEVKAKAPAEEKKPPKPKKKKPVEKSGNQ